MENSGENSDGKKVNYWAEGMALTGGLHLLLTSLQSSVLTVAQIIFLKHQAHHSPIWKS